MFQVVAQRPGTIFPFVCTRSQPDHFNTSSVLQELDIHTGSFSPASETVDHTGGSRDHGRPHYYLIGSKGCGHTQTTDIQPMVEQVTVVSLCVPNNRESHQQDRVLKGSLLRLSRCLHVATYTFIKMPPSSIGSHMAGKSPLPHFRVSAWAASRIHQFATCRTRHNHRSTRSHTVFIMMVTATIVSAEARPSPGPHSSP